MKATRATTAADHAAMAPQPRFREHPLRDHARPPLPALHDAASLRRIEARAAGQPGGDPFELMRRAGRAAWRCALRHWPQSQRIVVVCGPGNNGGDGYVLARYALDSGRDVRLVHLAGHEPRGDLARRALEDCRSRGGKAQVFDGLLPPADLVVDALFGIGLDRAPDPETANLIQAMNLHPAPRLALDVPSGVDVASGSAPGAAVRAHRTLEFIAPKAGLRTGPALDLAGSLEVAMLDLAPELVAEEGAVAELLSPVHLRRWLQARPRDAHKGQFGRVLCIGGDHGRGGAVILAAEAALRSGAGLVEVATRGAHLPALLARRPEAMGHDVERVADVADLLDRADVVAIGPGLGTEPWGRVMFGAALAAGKPLVLDADALNLLAARPRPLPPGTILTPHPGEAANLLGTDARRVQADRFEAARALCARHDVVVVLKGAGTIVAAPGRPPRILDAGNPGMAVAGMGDLLTGIIAALRAQGLAPIAAASAGVALHAGAVPASAAAVVHLSGDLGAGKSTLARAWLRALGVEGAVRSPTYTLVERYTLAGGAEGLHLDLYRIGDAGELEFLGLDGVDAALWLVEWPERGGRSLPAADLRVSLAIAGQGRDAVLEAGGEAGAAWLGRLVQERELRDVPSPD